jgi:ribosomal protein S18 acetylase RimI-like enzyme
MTDPEITTATPAHRDAVLASLVAAFVADPVLQYLFPDEATYPRHAAAFFGHLFDKRVHLGTVWTIDGGASVAMWDAPAAPNGGPGSGQGDDLAGALPAADLARVHTYEDTVRAALPTTPFWYLGVLGTDPRHAGRRWGHALLTAGLRRADAAGLPAVLETSNPGNVRVYQRAGFEVIRETAAEGLAVWVMRHPPA